METIESRAWAERRPAWSRPAGLVLLIGLACALPVAARQQSWQGAVTHVSDGDTLWVQPAHGGIPRKIRIDGIDAPEICQRHGDEARAVLAQHVLGQTVLVSARRQDDYGRWLARVRLQGQDVGRWLVLQGHAWSYRYRHSGGPYATEEAQARSHGLGLWQQARPMPPRVFRQRHGSCHG